MREKYIMEPNKIEIDSSVLDRLYEFYNVRIDDAHFLFDEVMIPVEDSEISTLNFYNSQYNPPYYCKAPGSLALTFIRKTVVDKLKSINEKLNEFNMELLIFDGFRPQSVQSFFSDVWVPEQLAKKYPQKSSDWIEKESSRYWASGAKDINTLMKRIPPHSTGGAVDLTIRFKDSKLPLEMGTIFDDISEKSHSDYFERNLCSTSYTEIEALNNRRLLYNLMTEAGFVNHPLEWWHFSYGDQLWGMISGNYAFYGYAGYQLGEFL
ncbi:M15 family metallopeptidase [Vibrio lentus]